MYFIHPDDIESPRFGTWADDFRTFEDACNYYGCDTPAQLAAEFEERWQDDMILAQDEMEARGGPHYGSFMHANDEIPY